MSCSAELVEVLSRLGLSRYTPQFEEEEITELNLLTSMGMKMLREKREHAKCAFTVTWRQGRDVTSTSAHYDAAARLCARLRRRPSVCGFSGRIPVFKTIYTSPPFLMNDPATVV